MFNEDGLLDIDVTLFKPLLKPFNELKGFDPLAVAKLFKLFKLLAAEYGWYGDRFMTECADGFW